MLCLGWLPEADGEEHEQASGSSPSSSGASGLAGPVASGSSSSSSGASGLAGPVVGVGAVAPAGAGIACSSRLGPPVVVIDAPAVVATGPPALDPPPREPQPAVVATGPPALPPLPPPAEPLPAEQLPLAGPRVVDVVGPKAFVQWIRGLTPERLDAVTSGLTAFTEAEEQWRAENKAHVDGARSLPKGKFRLAQLLNFKRAVGVRFANWQATAGKESKSILKACCLYSPTARLGATPLPDIAHLSQFPLFFIRGIGFRPTGGGFPSFSQPPRSCAFPVLRSYCRRSPGRKQTAGLLINFSRLRWQSSSQEGPRVATVLHQLGQGRRCGGGLVGEERSRRQETHHGQGPHARFPPSPPPRRAGAEIQVPHPAGVALRLVRGHAGERGRHFVAALCHEEG